jgi:hypothetical protein
VHNSPYYNKPQEEWNNITKDLVEQYPLSTNEILEISLEAWSKLWNTPVGNQIPLSQLQVPATVVGYFFQKIFTYILQARYPYNWRGEQDKEDKDIVNIRNSFFSTEMKTSGQLGYWLFGNRSYNQETTYSNISKNKSGYYITINFYYQTLTLIRIGWIDQDDWQSQKAVSGQAATLKPEVYQHKLIPISGGYRLNSPIGLLDGVGLQKANNLSQAGICTFRDMIIHRNNSIVQSVWTKNEKLLTELQNFV